MNTNVRLVAFFILGVFAAAVLFGWLLFDFDAGLVSGDELAADEIPGGSGGPTVFPEAALADVSRLTLPVGSPVDALTPVVSTARPRPPTPAARPQAAGRARPRPPAPAPVPADSTADLCSVSRSTGIPGCQPVGRAKRIHLRVQEEDSLVFYLPRVTTCIAIATELTVSTCPRHVTCQ